MDLSAAKTIWYHCLKPSLLLAIHLPRSFDEIMFFAFYKVWLREKRLSIDQFRAKYFRIIFSIWYPFGFLIASIELLFFKAKGF